VICAALRDALSRGRRQLPTAIRHACLPTVAAMRLTRIEHARRLSLPPRSRLTVAALSLSALFTPMASAGVSTSRTATTPDAKDEHVIRYPLVHYYFMSAAALGNEVRTDWTDAAWGGGFWTIAGALQSGAPGTRRPGIKHCSTHLQVYDVARVCRACRCAIDPAVPLTSHPVFLHAPGACFCVCVCVCVCVFFAFSSSTFFSCPSFSGVWTCHWRGACRAYGA